MLDYYSSISGGGVGALGMVGAFPDMRGKVCQFVVMFYKAKTIAFKGIYAVHPLDDSSKPLSFLILPVLMLLQSLSSASMARARRPSKPAAAKAR